MAPCCSFLLVITPPENNTFKNGSSPLLIRFSNSNAFDNAKDFLKIQFCLKKNNFFTFMIELAVFPFHTKSMYSYSDCLPRFSVCGSVRFGIRKLSRISLLRFDRSSEEATGDSRPRGVRLE